MSKPIPNQTGQTSTNTGLIVFIVLLLCGGVFCVFAVLLAAGLFVARNSQETMIQSRAVAVTARDQTAEYSSRTTTTVTVEDSPAPVLTPVPVESMPPMIQASDELDADVQQRIRKAIKKALEAEKQINDDLADAAWAEPEIERSQDVYTVKGAFTAGGQSYEYECTIRQKGNQTTVEKVSLK